MIWPRSGPDLDHRLCWAMIWPRSGPDHSPTSPLIQIWFLVPERKLLLLQLSLPLWLLLLFLLLLRFPPWLGYRNKCYRVCRSRVGLS